MRMKIKKLAWTLLAKSLMAAARFLRAIQKKRIQSRYAYAMVICKCPFCGQEVRATSEDGLISQIRECRISMEIAAHAR